MKVANVQVIDLFVSKHPGDPSTFFCRCGEKHKVSGTGFANQGNHVKFQHPEKFKSAAKNEIYEKTAFASSHDGVNQFLWKENTIKVHRCLKPIIYGLQPFEDS